MALLELLRAVAVRDEKAWGIFVERYGPLVWRILARFANLTPEDRRELSQEVFVVLMDRGLQQFRGSTDHEFRSYLRNVTANKAKSLLRKRGDSPEICRLLSLGDDDSNDENGYHGPQAVDPSPGPEQLVGEQEIRQQLLGCLAQIPLPHQEVFWLRERGVPYKEISRLLEVPQGTVAVRYHRAKERIMACLREAGVL